MIRKKINRHGELFQEFMLEETKEKSVLNLLLSLSAGMAMGHLFDWQVLALAVCLSVPFLYWGWLNDRGKGDEPSA